MNGRFDSEPTPRLERARFVDSEFVPSTLLLFNIIISSLHLILALTLYALALIASDSTWYVPPHPSLAFK